MTGAGRPVAYAVVDLGFGDAGKGLATDALVRRERADLVVRFNGGAQAGHNVVTPDGRHHTFSQVGAGAFVAGVRTVLSRDVVVHPTALLEEARALVSVGVADALDRTFVSDEALVVTPFHQAAGRLREIARGDARHGSCGVGVGEAVADALAHPDDAVRAGDLRDPTALLGRLARVRERIRAVVARLDAPCSAVAARERGVLERADVAGAWCERASPVASRLLPEASVRAAVAGARAVVFEGAQGLLLDERRGFHPHTTWSRCTAGGARRVLAEAAPGAPLRVVGVLRAHAVRHGPGPLPTEADAPRRVVAEHNARNDWQGPVRYGWFDAVLARYALALSPDVRTLLLTHVDAVARLPRWWVAVGYRVPAGAGADLVAGAREGEARDLAARADPPLERQERLGRLLAACEPILEEVPGDEATYLARLEAHLGRTIDAVARGPAAPNIEWRSGGA